VYIKTIFIKNFKSFKEIRFECNEKFNVLIGENNIGKSTLFEALLLWEFTFKKIISPSNKFYKADGGNSYISFNELDFIRLINDNDLFFESPNVARIGIEINIEYNKNFVLEFEFSRPKVIKNSYIRFKTINHLNFDSFSTYLRTKRITLDKVLFIYQTKPVSNILSFEPFMNKGQILRKIYQGKSGEVLRNKIISKKNLELISIENQISSVLNLPIKFECVNKDHLDKDEYINLKVNGKDIHLQGSGFLQITEIFSTVEYLENSINILLIDEPDSHIHSKLQHKLLEELRKIENTQTFIISHNDNFVNEINLNELFYLNQEAKTSGKIIKLNDSNFDNVKKDLGGIILALDKLNFSDIICFVEGSDDINYIDKIVNKIKQVEPNFQFQKRVTFSYLRGKDNLLSKLEYNKRFLTQVFRDKIYYVIYDKDFATSAHTADFQNLVTSKLGRNSKAICHNGYCIESIIFSDKDNLVDFLIEAYSTNPLRTKLFVEEYFCVLESDFSNILSDKYKLFEEKFSGQQNNSRPDIANTNFNDYIRDVAEVNFNHNFLFNKHLIKDFFLSFAKRFNLEHIPEGKSDDYYSARLLCDYIDSIRGLEQINQSIIDFVNRIYN